MELEMIGLPTFAAETASVGTVSPTCVQYLPKVFTRSNENAVEYFLFLPILLELQRHTGLVKAFSSFPTHLLHIISRIGRAEIFVAIMWPHIIAGWIKRVVLIRPETFPPARATAAALGPSQQH